MVHLVARRPLSAWQSRSSRPRRFRERHWHIPWRHDDRGTVDTVAVRLVADFPDLRTVGAGLFVRRGKDLGNELGHGVPARAPVAQRRSGDTIRNPCQLRRRAPELARPVAYCVPRTLAGPTRRRQSTMAATRGNVPP